MVKIPESIKKAAGKQVQRAIKNVAKEHGHEIVAEVISKGFQCAHWILRASRPVEMAAL